MDQKYMEEILDDIQKKEFDELPKDKKKKWAVIKDAVKKNKVAFLKYIIINEEIDINEKDEYGLNILHWCSIYGCYNYEISEILCDLGCDLNEKDKEWDKTALELAKEFDNYNIASLLAFKSLGGELRH